MSAETTPSTINLEAAKAKELVHLDTIAGKMDGGRYDELRADIDRRYAQPERPDAPKSERPVADAAARLALHQAAVAGDWDAGRIDLAENELARNTTEK